MAKLFGVFQSKVIDVDPDKCVVYLVNGSTLNYTAFSIDIGSACKRLANQDDKDGDDNAFDYANVIANRLIGEVNDEKEKERQMWVVAEGKRDL